MRRKDHTDSQSPSAASPVSVTKSVSGVLQGPAKQPLVSVVMPVFNVAPYLDASIMSVLNQSYENIELIIVNDASTDNSINIIRMYEDQDDRIKVINLEFNTLGGAGIPSNVGIDAALGEYIAFADSDDILDRLAIEKMVETALAQSAEIAFNPVDVPGVFDVSPVPWRKLYKQSFLNEHNIRYPEGDYFYEDNPLHWMVLSQASSVVMLDYVVALHRMERVGQTMGSDNYKMSAMFCHMNTVKKYFVQQGNVAPDIWKQLVNKSANYDWVLTASGQTAAQIGKSRFDIAKKIKEYNGARKDIDLTIIIPIYECEDLIDQTLRSLLGITGISYEVLMMDDGSTDKSFEICQDYAEKYSNFLLFSQKNKGAGVARNALIPLATGKYTYFLDSDDTINIDALADSVKFGIKGSMI
ncbi:uncharacterized glycosyltransferase RBE_0706-like [Phymastichus coffea]|uniref:uncharacterized glycosyltransferase RBE_0706-like n=1 Tax=Phymastichus coffea TaxID=108790 RepID=UPI00273B9B9C|nr:uncharacterized glycosyltransferase RBE_0706-like [Phymastichus coffea]